jgi:hypothetical protein
MFLLINLYTTLHFLGNYLNKINREVFKVTYVILTTLNPDQTGPFRNLDSACVTNSVTVTSHLPIVATAKRCGSVNEPYREEKARMDHRTLVV